MKSQQSVLTLFFLLCFLFTIQFSFSQCTISDITVMTYDCDSGDTFVGEFNFEYSGDVGEFFSYSISGQQNGEYPYDQLPMGLDIFTITDLEFLTITISDDTGSSCSSTSEFANPCFGNCYIYNISAIPSECNNDDKFDLVIDFEYSSTTDLFDLHINYENGIVVENIAYSDLPYTVTGLVEECISDIDILVYDSADDGCFSAIGIEPVCCSYDLCALDNLEIDLSECDGTEFLATINFDFIGTSDEFTYDLYDYWGAFVESGTYAYLDLPLMLDVDNTISESYQIVIRDADDTACVVNDWFDNPCFLDCILSNLTATPIECVDGFFNLVVDFEYENANETFDLHITYPYGSIISDIPYSSLPYTVSGLQEDCMSDIEVLVCDAEDGGCLDFITLPSVCCTDFCMFSDVNIAISECDGSEYSASVDFDYSGNVAQFDYVIYDYQSTQVQAGSYAYSDLPLELAFDNVESIVNYIVITDQEDASCLIDGFFDNPCYEGDCFIGELSVTKSDCNEDGLFDVTLDFEYENASDQFTVNGNANSYGTFSYADLPITLEGLEGDCETEFEFVVHDVNNNDCISAIEVGVVCCEEESCNIFSIDFGDTPFCENGFILTEWFIFSENTSEVGFDIFINNEFLTFVEFNEEGPYGFDIPDPGTENYAIKACDNDNSDCCYTWELENPCYEEQQDCTIGEISVTQSNCNEDGLFDVTLDFEYENTSDLFTVNGNANSYGTFSYADLPITLEGLGGDCETEFEFAVYDVNNNDCTSNIDYGVVCCEEESCNIYSIDFGDNPICENGFILTEWFIFSESTSEVGFDIFINNEFLTFLEFNEEGPYGFDIPDPGTENYAIKACDNDNSDCCYTWELENPCYEEEPCSIGSISVEPSECNDAEEFFVTLDFEHENTSDQFTIVGNGMDYGLFNYADLPITIDGLSGDCETEYEFIVQDLNNNDCINSAGLDPVCCEEAECQMTTLDFGVNPVCENGLIVTEWLIDGDNTSETGYDIFINGEFQLFIAYEEDSWYDFNIEAPDTENFTITVCDNDNPDCCIDWELENPCYEPPVGDCFIDDVTATVTACEGNIFDVLIDFEYEDVSGQFIVNGNGNSYGTFSYADLPISLTGLEADCDTEFEFVIQDIEVNDCTAFVDYGTVCCEDFNNIQEITITNSLDGNIINIDINVFISLLNGCDLEVFMDGEYYILLTEETTSFDIGPFDCGTDQVILLSIVNNCTDITEEFAIDLSDIECTTSVTSFEIADVIIWNQVEKQLVVNQLFDGNYNLQVLNIDGKLISQKSKAQSGDVFDLLGINSGIYIVRLRDENNGKIGLMKILVY